MMKKAWVVAAVLLFVSAAGFAQKPSQAPLSSEALAAILGQPAAACGSHPSEMRFAAVKDPLQRTVTCTATCESGTVSCSAASTCSAVNRNCSANEPGHVTCNGVTTWCPTACTCTGTPAQIRCCQCDQTGDCMACCRCDGGTIGQCARVCG